MTDTRPFLIRSTPRPHEPGAELPLSQQVADLQERTDAAMHLLGEIIATFQLQPNRDKLAESATGNELLAIADGWIRRYRKIPDGRVS